MYLYDLPTTTAVSFSDFCVDQSLDKIYTHLIPVVSDARANLRGTLKESKRTDHADRDYLRLVKVVEEYVPHLRAVMTCIAHDEIGLKGDPSFGWKTTLSVSHFIGSETRLVSFPHFHPELALTLISYAFALSNLARATVISLGYYEGERAISDADRRAKDDSVNVAVGWLRKASGVFTYIGEKLLPEWEASRGGSGNFGLSGGRPPELAREVHHALAKMALAEAQTLAIRKLLSQAAYESNISPGPPLPKSHPSPMLIAKLHLECATLYLSARTLVKTAGESSGPSRGGGARKFLSRSTSDSSSNVGGGEVSAELRHYLADEGAWHNALAQKWLGVNAGEKGGSEKGGEAVGFLDWARKDMVELKDRWTGVAKGLTKGKEGKEKAGLRKDRVAGELDAINVFHNYYKKINDSLYCQPVPTQSELQSRIPTGKLAIAAIPFEPPLPAFGPGSLEHARRQTEGLHLSSEDGLEVVMPHDSTTSPTTASGTYAGAGAYF